ncbi:MAG TPA: DMT family transporter [Amphiplicatus sp.]|nr:DMT family transporter [Caulobacterales bacterium]HOP20107.1 DMT family transporter [Amphiplicatus sp.]
MSPRELFVLIAMCTVWGFHFVVIKVTVETVPPMFYASMRMALVALLLSPWLRWRPGKMKTVLLAGVCYGALNYSLMFTGLRLAPASVAAIIGQLYVPFATILSVVFLSETVRWRRILGISLAFAGVAVIALSKGSIGAADERLGVGAGLLAAAALVEATGSTLVKSSKGFKPYELLAWFAVIGTISLTPATWLLEKGQMEALAASNKLMLGGAIVYSAVLASIFGHTAYYWLLQRLPVSLVAPSSLLIPVFAVTFSVLFLGEALSVRFFIGGALAMTGVAIVLLRTTKGRIVEPGAPEAVVVAPPQEEKQ